MLGLGTEEGGQFRLDPVCHLARRVILVLQFDLRSQVPAASEAGAPACDSSCSKTRRIRSRGERPSAAGGRRVATKGAVRSFRVAASRSSLLSNSWYMERFDTPAALHSASTPILTPSW